MMRRTFLAALTAVPLALIATACGSDGGTGRGDVDTGASTAPPTDPPTTEAPGTDTPTTSPTTPPSTAIVHPTGRDDVVLRLSWEGGFVMEEYAFRRLPRLLITGDGTVYTEGATPAIYPGPLVSPVFVGKITEDQLQELLATARDADLFRTVEYQANPNIADAADTRLEIHANGATFVHTAYALDLEEQTDADRDALRDYVERLEDLAASDLGSTPYAPSRFAINATPAAQAPAPEPGITPAEVAWPAGAGVGLATAGECAVVEGEAVASLFASAKQDTRFVDDDVAYVLFVRPLLPGDHGC
jgi:hypothetical protein